jgi:hypothetical protein
VSDAEIEAIFKATPEAKIETLFEQYPDIEPEVILRLAGDVLRSTAKAFEIFTPTSTTLPGPDLTSQPGCGLRATVFRPGGQ